MKILQNFNCDVVESGEKAPFFGGTGSMVARSADALYIQENGVSVKIPMDELKKIARLKEPGLTAPPKGATKNQA